MSTQVGLRAISACLLVARLAVGPAGCSTVAPDNPDEPTTALTSAVGRNAALQAELVRLGEEDQAERMGNPELPPGTKLGPPQDYARAKRLKAIVAEYGWPTYDLVGEDGASAAWLIAQHADFDVALQQEALRLLDAAVEAGQGSPADLAYLSDRVAVNLGLPQTYGSQVRCQAGAPAPATPLVDESSVDKVRKAAGLGTLQEYYSELALMCANEEMDEQRVP